MMSQSYNSRPDDLIARARKAVSEGWYNDAHSVLITELTDALEKAHTACVQTDDPSEDSSHQDKDQRLRGLGVGMRIAVSKGMTLTIKKKVPVRCVGCLEQPTVEPGYSDWQAVCHNCYDGAPDGAQWPAAHGETQTEAVQAWNERMWDLADTEVAK